MSVNRNPQYVTRVLLIWLVVALIVGALLVILPSAEALAQPVVAGLHPGVNITVSPTEEPADYVVYLPLAMKNYPFIAAPVLNAISNTDGDGNYTVGWSSSEGADTYTLQEDDNAGFSSPTTVYSGSSISTAISGRDVGTYYYRNQASNVYASSGWSNVESVAVTVAPPPCPQGYWLGTTNYGRAIGIDVESLPQCHIAPPYFYITIFDTCGYLTITYFRADVPITDGHFDADTGWVRVIGNFTSLTTASGTWSMNRPDPYTPTRKCTGSGTWTAHPWEGAVQ